MYMYVKIPQRHFPELFFLRVVETQGGHPLCKTEGKSMLIISIDILLFNNINIMLGWGLIDFKKGRLRLNWFETLKHCFLSLACPCLAYILYQLSHKFRNIA